MSHIFYANTNVLYACKTLSARRASVASACLHMTSHACGFLLPFYCEPDTHTKHTHTHRSHLSRELSKSTLVCFRKERATNDTLLIYHILSGYTRWSTNLRMACILWWCHIALPCIRMYVCEFSSLKLLTMLFMCM